MARDMRRSEEWLQERLAKSKELEAVHDIVQPNAKQAAKRKPKPFKLTPYTPTEAQVQASIVDAIRKLGLGEVVRYNSGAMYNAKQQYVRFNSAPGHSDTAGTLKPSGRAFYLECKPPGWKGPRDERERDQAAFLDSMRACGAIAEFVRSVDEALAALGYINREINNQCSASTIGK